MIPQVSISKKTNIGLCRNIYKVSPFKEYRNGDKLMEITKTEMFVTETVRTKWTAVSFNDPQNEEISNFIDGNFGYKKYNNGWQVVGRFFMNNMGPTFALSYATNNKFENAFVMGRYDKFGVVSNNKKALEDFVGCFPPLQLD